MQPLEFLVPIGALEQVGSLIPYVILVLVLANIGTRFLAHKQHLEQAEDGAEAISRNLAHQATSFLLMLSSFAFLIVHHHGGMVMSVLVIGMVIADFFEFEARKVEARNNMELEKPKSAVVASVVVFLYAGFQSVFFIVAPVWNAIV